MEDTEVVRLANIVVVVGILLMPASVFAYDDRTTHPALTKEVIRFFNNHYSSLRLSDDDARKVVRGSIDEDRAPRWLNHFYDPVKNRGLVLGEVSPELERELAFVLAGSRDEWPSSKEWAQNTVSQAGGGLAALWTGVLRPYFSGGDDFSWDRAMYEYAWGDKNRGLEALGHVLHLLEDATVPDHTRNDPHPPILDWGSPYEFWAMKFSESSIDVFATLDGKNPVVLDSLDNYFDRLASFSNRGFFSEDTILDSEYTRPDISRRSIERLSDGQEYEFGYVDGDSGSYRLVLISSKKLGRAELIYTINDPDNLILRDYWTRLSEQAVLHGAGVMKLFFDEVEKEKQTKVLLRKNQSLLEKVVDASQRKIIQFVAATRRIATETARELADASRAAGKKAGEIIQKGREKIFSEAAVILGTEPTLASSPPPIGVIDAEPIPPEAFPNPKETPLLPGGPPEANLVSLSEIPLPEVVQRAPEPPGAADSGGSDSAPQGSGASIANTPPSEPQPSPSPAPQPAPPIAPSSGTSSPPTPTPTPTLTPPPDTTPPDITLAITECAESFSPEGCLVATTTLAVLWSSNSGDWDHYVVECKKGESNCPTFSYNDKATSTLFAAENDSDYVFRAKAVDTSGNESNFIEKTVSVNLMLVVINEMAWAGTEAGAPQDEWLELYNRSSKAIPLNGWILRSITDDKPHLNLTGTIAGNGYYLIERTDDNTISDMTADLIAPFGSGSGMGLIDSGEVLVLEKASTTMDQTPPLDACQPRGWCGGGKGASRETMERIDPDLAGALADSWGTNDSIIQRGRSARGSAIHGTPRSGNSRSYYISQGAALTASKTLLKSKSPFFIGPSGLTINPGVTLEVKPGVIVKFYPNSQSLTVDGTLKAIGAAAENIVFTSFLDDEFGGDMNNDATSTSPVPGNWPTIALSSSSENSELAYVRVRYGGSPLAQSGRALVRAENSSVSISNSVFERSLQHGLWLANSTSTITNSTFRENNVDDLSSGIWVEGGAPVVRDSTFTANAFGIRFSNEAQGQVSGNVFSGNRIQAAYVIASTPVFSSNTAAANGINGIVMSGTLFRDYEFSTGLPYVFEDNLFLGGLDGAQSFRAGGGAVFKGKNQSARIFSRGAFSVSGNSSNPVVFTSFADDAYGGDTNNNGLGILPVPGDWAEVRFLSTATSSAVNYGVVRYGGSSANAAITLDSLEANVANTLFENNGFRALGLIQASSTLSSLVFRNNTLPNSDAALYLGSNSRAVLSNSLFENNKRGILAEGGATMINGGGNEFINNQTDTIPPGLLP